MASSKVVEQRTRTLGLPFLGEIPYDEEVEESLGNKDRLMNTVFAENVKLCVPRILGNRGC